MKLLNLGCGYRFATEKEWTNLDFIGTGEGVIAHNLLTGIPFASNSFDFIYHSHVLEHLSKKDGDAFIGECFRVLKPGGIIRIAVPDLEKIARNYLAFLEGSLRNENAKIAKANYEWTLLEMYDQAVRNHSGGEMKRYLFNKEMKNEAFVFERIGQEAKSLRDECFASIRARNNNSKKSSLISQVFQFLRKRTRKYLFKILKVNEKALEIGDFRLRGEVHMWMYDRFSMTQLLNKQGFISVEVRDAWTSYLTGWSRYKLDAVNDQVRKPDSLFIEARKP